MFKRLLTLLALALGSLAFASTSFASGGNYVFQGGTPLEHSQVRQALNASSFPWDIVPGPVVVHIGPVGVSYADPGNIWLDSSLLDDGEFSWGVIQHEYAHQVDFSLLDAADRAQLATVLGGTSWWSDGIDSHGNFTCERFASTLAWAYWPSAENAMRPDGPQDEAAHVAPVAFRAALVALLPQAAPVVRMLDARRRGR